MEKRRIITSYEKLGPELKKAVLMQYPDGYMDSVKKIDKPNGDFFYAFNLVTEDTIYMVKIKLDIDENLDDLDESIYGGSDKDSEKESKLVEFDDNDVYDED